MGTRVGEPHAGPGMQVRLVGEVEVAVRVVEERREDHPVPVVGEQLVDHQADRILTGAPGDGADRGVGVGLVVDVAVGHRPPLVELVEHDLAEQSAVVRLDLQRPAQVRRTERGHLFLEGPVGVRPERRVEGERVEASLETHQQAHHPPGHLGDDRDAVGGRFVEQAQHVTPEVGRTVGLVEIDAHGASRAAGQLAHPRPFAGRHVDVVRRELEHAVAGAAQRVGDPVQLVGRRVRPRHELAGLRSVDRGARGREAQRAGPQAALDDLGHRVDVGAGRLFVRRTTVTHHVAAHRAVRHLGADVDRVPAGVERVEVLLERLPLPGHPLGQRGARDVLHALHQLDQPLVPVGCRRREADAAIAHHHRGDAVPRRWRQVRVPRRLAVVVRVDIDPPGRHEQPVGVDGGRRRSTAERPRVGDLGDHTVGHGDIGDPGRCSAAVDQQPPGNHQIVHRGHRSSWYLAL